MKTIQSSNAGGANVAYDYDTRNRLTNLGVAKGGTNLAGYSYLLDGGWPID